MTVILHEHHSLGVTVTLKLLKRWTKKTRRREVKFRQVRIVDVDAGRTTDEHRRRWLSIRGTVRCEQWIPAQERWLWDPAIVVPPDAEVVSVDMVLTAPSPKGGD